MTIQKRSIIAAVMVSLALVFYGAARHYSPSLILYVVEQSLAQKAPAGTDSILLRERLHAILASAPNQSVRMEKLLRISEYLEKVQHLSYEEIDRILAMDKPGTPPVL
jgi:hypothetical protein